METYINKIVEQPIKVDLHIHSEYSITKDSIELIGEGTKENLKKLVEKLNYYQVNMASITDHDYFSFEMYKSFKSFEGTGSLKKVLPGIEFSVGFENDKKVLKQVHVIAIFDDSDDEKLAKIETEVLPLIDGKVQYDCIKEQLFSESQMIAILRKINLNVILIAHQKNSINSSKIKAPDLKCVGEDAFEGFLTSEVFEALEFKSMKNGLFNNLFALEKNKEYNYDVVKFITGSDCHQWEVYPAYDLAKKNLISDFKHTYLKCLPTFKGLTMALSDYSRIQLGNSFFSIDDSKIDVLKISIDEKNIEVPMSHGINAIIGDNSIGKSLLLHKITDYSNTKDEVKKGYEEYLLKNKIIINSFIPREKLYYFDYQGNIRQRFEKKDDSKNQNFLNDKFPPDPIKSSYETIIQNEFEKLYELLTIKFEYDDQYSKLKTLLLSDKDITSKMVSSSQLPNNKVAINSYSLIVKYLTDIENKINDPSIYKCFEQVDVDKLKAFKEDILVMKTKYNGLLNNEKYKYKIKAGINNGISNFKDIISGYKDEDTKVKEQYDSDTIEVAQIIAKLVSLKQKIKKFEFNLKEDVKVEISTLNYNGYNFIRRFKNAKKISNEYLNEILSSCLKNNKSINTETITLDDFVDNILKDYNKSTQKPIEFLKNKVNEKIKNDFTIESVILKAESDVYENLSNGLNSTLYFDIISGDSKSGIYMIDQPEDDVSQNSIKTNLIQDFKKMSQKRQIILITHNPQFVVNLDVDNVICIHKDKNDKVVISSGALEYEDESTNIIKLVADNLDGGVDSIRKRWKRYGKELRTN